MAAVVAALRRVVPVVAAAVALSLPLPLPLAAAETINQLGYTGASKGTTPRDVYRHLPQQYTTP